MKRITAELAEKLLREHARDLPEDIAQELVWIADFIGATEERRKFDTDSYRVNSNVKKEAIKTLKQQLATEKSAKEQAEAKAKDASEWCDALLVTNDCVLKMAEQLEAECQRMKCCGNCNRWCKSFMTDDGDPCVYSSATHKCDKWEG